MAGKMLWKRELYIGRWHRLVSASFSSCALCLPA